MVKTPIVPQLSEPGGYKQVFRDGERVLLTVEQRWPRLKEDCPGLKRLGRYCESFALRWRARWEGELLERARAAAGPDTPPWEARLDYTLTLFQDGLLSFYWDVTEDVAARRPHRLRSGETWQLPAAVPLSLRELLPPQRWWRGMVLEEVRRQIGRRVGEGEAVFFDDWIPLASRRFSPARFYLTKEGPVVFYPMESIAPALEGFPSFLLPFPPGERPSEGSEMFL